MLRMPQIAGLFSTKTANKRALLRKMTIKIKHPMGLQHFVAHKSLYILLRRFTCTESFQKSQDFFSEMRCICTTLYIRLLRGFAAYLLLNLPHTNLQHHTSDVWEDSPARAPLPLGSHCNTLQHSVAYCNTLQHSEKNCSTLQHTCSCPAAPRLTLPHTASHCNTLSHTATHCTTPAHTTSNCYTPQHTSTHCYTLQHTCSCPASTRLTPQQPASQRNILQHIASQCRTLQQTARHYNTLACDQLPPDCNTQIHAATHCNTLQHTCSCPATTLLGTTTSARFKVPTVHCNTLKHSAALQHTATHLLVPSPHQTRNDNIRTFQYANCRLFPLIRQLLLHPLSTNSQKSARHAMYHTKWPQS